VTDPRGCPRVLDDDLLGGWGGNGRLRKQFIEIVSRSGSADVAGSHVNQGRERHQEARQAVYDVQTLERHTAEGGMAAVDFNDIEPDSCYRTPAARLGDASWKRVFGHSADERRPIATDTGGRSAVNPVPRAVSSPSRARPA
jgi:hypothetical protein